MHGATIKKRKIIMYCFI